MFSELTGWAIEELLNLTSKGIFTLCIWIGPYPIVCILDAEDIQVTYLSDSFTHFN